MVLEPLGVRRPRHQLDVPAADQHRVEAGFAQSGEAAPPLVRVIVATAAADPGPESEGWFLSGAADAVGKGAQRRGRPGRP